MAKFIFDAPVPTLPPELLEKVVAAGKILQRRRAAAEAAAASVGENHTHLSDQLDEALRSGDPDAIAAATDQLKLVRPPIP